MLSLTLWPNFILLVCVGIIASLLGFIVYGCIVGFENVLEEPEADAEQKEEGRIE